MRGLSSATKKLDAAKANLRSRQWNITDFSSSKAPRVSKKVSKDMGRTIKGKPGQVRLLSRVS
jgi:hypothetical protein